MPANADLYQRLREIGEAPADFFLDACRLIGTEPPYRLPRSPWTDPSSRFEADPPPPASRDAAVAWGAASERRLALGSRAAPLRRRRFRDGGPGGPAWDPGRERRQPVRRLVSRFSVR